MLWYSGNFEAARTTLKKQDYIPRMLSNSRFKCRLRRIKSGEILGNLATSLVSLGIGYGLAVVVGVTVGALTGRYRNVEDLLDIYLNAFLASPSPVYVPILFAFFGVSRPSQFAVVYLYAVFILTANTAR